MKLLSIDSLHSINKDIYWLTSLYPSIVFQLLKLNLIIQFKEAMNIVSISSWNVIKLLVMYFKITGLNIFYSQYFKCINY